MERAAALTFSPALERARQRIQHRSAPELLLRVWVEEAGRPATPQECSPALQFSLRPSRLGCAKDLHVRAVMDGRIHH
jgi:hypothetical protein